MYLDVDYEIKANRVYVENRTICIVLKDETVFRFPAECNKKLADASDSQLSNLELICGGAGIHWAELDEDLSISGILAGRYGA